MEVLSMGSRIMHYYIATKLLENLDMEHNGFVLGNLAPDVYSSSTELKNRSHFMKPDRNDVIYIDYDLFHETYLRLNPSPFHLGYYFHLITDDIWLNEIYYKEIRWLPPGVKREAKKAYYRDFRRLNKKLIEKYSMDLVPIDVQYEADIAEIDSSLLPNLLSDLRNDFRLADSNPDEPLEVLVFEEVLQVLDMTVERCISCWNLQTNR